MQIQGIAMADGLTWKEVILGVLIPLVLGSYAYAWLGSNGLWAGLKDLRQEMLAGFREIRENDVRHLEERIERLERGR